MSRINPTPLDSAVDEQYAAAGFTDDTGNRNMMKVCTALLGVLQDRIVETSGEVKEKAVSRATLVEKLFPLTPGPGDWAEQEDPMFAELVWKRLSTDLWNECRTDYKAWLQRLIESTLNGQHVLVRGRVSIPDLISVVYITTDPDLAYGGVAANDIAILARKYEVSEGNLAMLMRRYPDQAQRMSKRFTRATKSITAGVHQRVALMASEVAETEADES